jgi:hypothetical protein
MPVVRVGEESSFGVGSWWQIMAGSLLILREARRVRELI